MFTYLKKNNEGMTLVELAAGMVIAVMLMVASLGVYTAFHSMTNRYVRMEEVSRVAQVISDMVEEKLTYASSLEVSRYAASSMEESCSLHFAADGRVHEDGEELFLDAFYQGMQVYCDVINPESNQERNLLEYRISLEDENNTPFYSLETVVKLVNLELNGGEIQYTGMQPQSSGQKDLYFYYKVEGDG